jgi:hypothetical protein
MHRISALSGSFFLAFLLHGFSMAAPTLVQSVKCQDWRNYLDTYQCSFHETTRTGSAIIAFVLVSGRADIAVTGVRDDRTPDSNVYLEDLHYLFGDMQNIYFFSVAGAGAAQALTIKASDSTHFQVVLMEVSGLAPSNHLKDRTSTYDNGYNGGRTFTSGLTQRTTQPDEFLVGWSEQIYPNVMSFTDDPPWTLVEQQPLGGSRIAYRTTSTQGTFAYTGRFSGTGEYRVGAAIITYKAAPAKE